MCRRLKETFPLHAHYMLYIGMKLEEVEARVVCFLLSCALSAVWS